MNSLFLLLLDALRHLILRKYCLPSQRGWADYGLPNTNRTCFSSIEFSALLSLYNHLFYLRVKFILITLQSNIPSPPISALTATADLLANASDHLQRYVRRCFKLAYNSSMVEA